MSKNTDNRRLRTSKRDTVSNDQYAAFMRRLLPAYARRVAAGDIDALADMLSLATDLETAIRQAVIGLREVGYSWTEIAARLGVSRQAVRQRWGGDQG